MKFLEISIRRPFGCCRGMAATLWCLENRFVAPRCTVMPASWIQLATWRRKNIAAFEQAEVDAVISNASGCGAKLKEYGMLLADDKEFAERAARFSQKVKDIASFLDGLPSLAKPGEMKLRVAYDDPCHLLHAMKVSHPPRNVLRSIPGLELVELSTPEQCCGSAGIYNITNYELSMRILQRKINDIKTATRGRRGDREPWLHAADRSRSPPGRA